MHAWYIILFQGRHIAASMPEFFLFASSHDLLIFKLTKVR